MKQHQTLDLQFFKPSETRHTASTIIKNKPEIAFKVGLPQIHKNKTIHNKAKFYSEYHSTINEQIGSFQEKQMYLKRYAWLKQSIEYSEQTEEMIQQENKKLKNSLYEMNMEIENVIKRVVRPQKIRVKTVNDNVNTLKVREKEVENNKSIIGLCRKQFKTLQRQKSHIKQKGREFFESSIEKTKLNLDKTRKQTVNLKKTNKILGNSIIGTDSIISNLKTLEEDVIAFQKKKIRLKYKNNEVKEQIEDVNEKIRKIGNDYERAEQFLTRNTKNVVDQEKNIKITENLSTFEYREKILNRKIQMEKQNYQKIYHQKLKQLDHIRNKTNEIEVNIQERQQQCVLSKAEVLALQDKLRKMRGRNQKMPVTTITDILMKETASKIFNRNGTTTDKNEQAQSNVLTNLKQVGGQTQEANNKEDEDPFEVSSNISSIHEEKPENVEIQTKKQR